MTTDTKVAKTYQHHYVCNKPLCRRQHALKSALPRPEHPSRLCKCGATAWYRYTNFVGDAKGVTRAHYAFRDMVTAMPTDANYQPLKAGETQLGSPPPPPAPATGKNPWGRTPAPLPHNLRQGRRGWVVGTPEQELKHALNLLDEVLSSDKGLTGQEFTHFCNDALPFMHAHGRQKYTDSFA
jgi:hypothetical protein